MEGGKDGSDSDQVIQLYETLNFISSCDIKVPILNICICMLLYNDIICPEGTTFTETVRRFSSLLTYQDFEVHFCSSSRCSDDTNTRLNNDTPSNIAAFYTA